MEQLIAAAADTTPIDVNMDNFMAEVIDGSATMPIVVQFWAPWCGPCKQLGPLLEKVVAAAKGKVKMVRINIDENQQIAQQMRVQSVPTVYGFFNGQPVDGFAGAQPESTLKQFIDKLVAAGGSGPDIAAMAEAANSLLETQDYDNAMAQYHEIMAADPESPDGLAGMIRCMVGMRDIDGAREIVDQLDDEFRDKPAMVIAIDSLELAEKVAGAAGGLTQARAAVDADPNDLAARQELALALFATGEQAESMEQLLESIRIDRAWNDEAARMQLLEFFKTLGPANRDVVAARRKLSTLLFA
ncbi:MAG: thioredoxin [Proteobacteria bacterium]|jgi:putative thioredoxin|nr:thioredoxin [Candidatus Puniceispirillum sp.]MDA0800541.1 thioredoxin [Pseudomonadota bacterium]MDA0884516.1 thioredoxin [Pseudomonadota bacterium]MDA1149272.1 thioredoxin [Pseudomonadota bacterium]